MNGKDKLWTEKEAAERLGLSLRTLRAWRRTGKGSGSKRSGRAAKSPAPSPTARAREGGPDNSGAKGGEK